MSGEGREGGRGRGKDGELGEGDGQEEVYKVCGAWWLIWYIRRLSSEGSESRSSRHVGTLGMSFTRSCRSRFGVKLRYSIRAVSGAPLSSS